MCGLGAIIWKSGESPGDARSLLARFERGLLHRGPDEGAIHISKGFAVVHRRLAIVDISDGQQPMFACDDKVGIAYNGEIYNHLRLRRDLEARGHVFQTRCDTEVVLKAYLEYGTAAFNRLDGMFAILIWDFRESARGEFHVVRDHIGTKPLYVYEDNSRFIISSEMRAITSIGDLDLTLDQTAIHSYLTFRYTASPKSLFRNINRVEAGTRWHIRDGRATRWRYWDLPDSRPSSKITLNESAEQLSSLLLQSVQEQQMGEAPIALLLSGGLDSSAIAHACYQLGANYHTFNIGFPTVNEFEYSHAVAERFDQKHTTLETSIDEMAALFPNAVDAMDEPMADPACLPLYVLCKEIRKHATVVLSGEGSDELFGGYPQYGRLLTSSPESTDAQFKRFLECSWYFMGSNVPVTGGFDQATTRQHYSYFAERPLLDGMLAFDLKTWLPENLMMKADKILMSQSLEGRFPFLSRKIIEFAFSLPEELKWNGLGKIVLRAAMKDALPDVVLTRPKMGFSVPVSELLGRLKARLLDLLGCYRQTDLASTIDFDQLTKFSSEHFSGSRDRSLLLWNAFVMLQWFDGRAFLRRSINPLTSGAEVLQLRSATQSVEKSNTDRVGSPILKRLPKRPLRIVSYRWHAPHQYEIYKLPHQFTLLTGTGTGFTNDWEYRQRPLKSNVRMLSVHTDFNPRDYDLAILHFDENVLCPHLSNGVLSSDWGDSFKWLLENADVPCVAVCHGTVPFIGQYGANPNRISNFEPIESERLRLVEALRDVEVVCNSHQAASEWRFYRQRVIWHGMDPTEFPAGSHEYAVVSHGLDKHRPHYRGLHDLLRISELLGDAIPVASHRHDTTALGDPDHPAYTHLSFRAWVDHLRRFKIYLNTTLRSPMPRARTEAMMCGVIPVSMRNHDVDRFIENGKNGFYADSPEELTDAIHFVLANENARKKIAHAARSTAIRTFNNERFLRDWEKMLNELGF